MFFATVAPPKKTVQETFQTVRKLSRLSGNFPHPPETFQSVWKLSRLSKNFPDCVETFQTLWKLSKLSGNFPNCPIYFQTVWKPSRLMLCFELILSQFCRYAQKLSRRAKTFRSAMPTRRRGFSDSDQTIPNHNH